MWALGKGVTEPHFYVQVSLSVGYGMDLGWERDDRPGPVRRLPDSPVGADQAQDGPSQRSVQPGSQPGRPAPHTLQGREGNSALFPKTATGRKASTFTRLVKVYTTLTQTLL